MLHKLLCPTFFQFSSLLLLPPPILWFYETLLLTNLIIIFEDGDITSQPPPLSRFRYGTLSLFIPVPEYTFRCRPPLVRIKSAQLDSQLLCLVSQPHVHLHCTLVLSLLAINSILSRSFSFSNHSFHQYFVFHCLTTAFESTQYLPFTESD